MGGGFSRSFSRKRFNVVKILPKKRTKNIIANTETCHSCVVGACANCHNVYALYKRNK